MQRMLVMIITIITTHLISEGYSGIVRPGLVLARTRAMVVS